MDTVYLALDVFQWKTPSELGTEQNYAPPYIVAISKYVLDVLYWNVYSHRSYIIFFHIYSNIRSMYTQYIAWKGQSNVMARGEITNVTPYFPINSGQTRKYKFNSAPKRDHVN